MTEFKYTHLTDINVLNVMNAFPEWDEEFAQDAYKHWFHHYSRFASICYRAQFAKHREIVWNDFCRKYAWPTDELLDGEQQYVYDDFAAAEGFTRHEENHQRIQSYMANKDTDLDPDRPIFTSSHDIYQHWLARLLNPEVAPEDEHIQFQIYALWFNTIIHNEPEQIALYKRMPYEDYLNTDHWRRVRTAMLIAHRGRCQATTCWQMDSYWFDEKWLHVHHMTYKNRGNERFADLRLVCRDCHNKIHDGITDIFPDHLVGFYGMVQS